MSKVCSPSGVVDLTTGDLTPITGFPLSSLWRSARAVLPDGFCVVLTDMGEPQLWLIPPDGVAQQVGVYPALEPGISARDYSSTLSSSGDLFQIGSISATFTDLIVRRRLNGFAQVVYTEADDPVVKLHISSLITGP